MNIKNVSRETKIKKLSFLPASRALAKFELEMSEVDESINFLKNALLEVGDDFDYVLIDSPPSLGL